MRVYADVCVHMYVGACVCVCVIHTAKRAALYGHGHPQYQYVEFSSNSTLSSYLACHCTVLSHAQLLMRGEFGRCEWIFQTSIPLNRLQLVSLVEWAMFTCAHGTVVRQFLAVFAWLV